MIMQRETKKQAKRRELKNRLEVLEMVADIRFSSDPTLALKLKQKLREEYKKKLI